MRGVKMGRKLEGEWYRRSDMTRLQRPRWRPSLAVWGVIAAGVALAVLAGRWLLHVG